MANETPHNEIFEELCAGYVLRSLDEDEHREFEQMLEKASEEEYMLYQKMKSAANQLAFTVERHEPNPVIKEQLMDQIRSAPVREDQPKNEIVSAKDDQEVAEDEGEEGLDWSAFGMAASFALLIITLSLMFYAFNLRSEISENESVIEEQENQIAELQDELQQKEEMLAVLESREVDMVLMSGMEVNPEGYGKVIWNEDNPQALLQITNLPAVPADSVYQLWILTGDEPISADVFSVTDETERFFLIEKFNGNSRQSANGFAVTLEPENGSRQPSGDMYLMGNME